MSESVSEIIGRSGTIKRIIKKAKKIAKSERTTILILGESGTGKEYLFNLIHNLSPRRSKPKVALNCAALPEHLLEDELFGHEEGAFTGANKLKIGKFELAKGGTIFLDEIGEMSLKTQSKILRVLQEGEFYRLGGNELISVDVRVIAATNINLEKAVYNRRFRKDLFYRLNVISIFMPPLRERKGDILLFVDFFLRKFQEEMKLKNLDISIEAKRALLKYDWPGNVRELKNAIEHGVVMRGSDILEIENFPKSLFNEERRFFETIEECGNADILVDAVRMFRTACQGLPRKGVQELFGDLFTKIVIEEMKGNLTKAAVELGISYKTMMNITKRLRNERYSIYFRK